MTPPVLLLTFNRFKTTCQVFEAIRIARPSRLYLASDGPRKHKIGENNEVNRIREYIGKRIDWQCEVKFLLRDENLGCELALRSAITWFFDHEAEGIILEDDCLPHPDFFVFCSEALKYYRNNNDVFAISGTNICTDLKCTTTSIFSLMGGNWGWATWRRAWQFYRNDIVLELTNENWERIAHNLDDIELFKCVKEQIEVHATWDFQWLYRRLLENKVTVVPCHNLISNIGFGEESTHTFDVCNPLAFLKTSALPRPFWFEDKIEINKRYDNNFVRHYAPSLLSKLLKKIKGVYCG